MEGEGLVVGEAGLFEFTWIGLLNVASWLSQPTRQNAETHAEQKKNKLRKPRPMHSYRHFSVAKLVFIYDPLNNKGLAGGLSIDPIHLTKPSPAYSKTRVRRP